VVIQVLTNDDTLNCNIDTLYQLDGPVNGILSPGAVIGEFTYTPNQDFCGVDSFAYVLCTQAGCDTAIVNITVSCNCTLPPVAVNDTVSTAINTNINIDVLLNDTSDCPLDTLYIGIAANNGGVVLLPGGTNGDLVNYIPNLDFCGLDSFQYIICNELGCDTAWVFIDILCCEGAPIALNDTTVTAFETAVDIAVLDNDTTNCPLISITIITPPTNGTAVQGADSIYNYTPAPLYCGPDSFQYAICNEIGCDTAWVFINMDCDFELPIAVTECDTTMQGIADTFFVLLNDTINGPLTSITVITEPTNGVAVVLPDVGLYFTPFAGFCGTDSLYYEICNPTGCDTAFVCITISCLEFEIFTGYTPNSDGQNDVFTINGVQGLPGNRLSIYNRWGNRVYFKDNYDNSWGFDWEGNLLPDGTYFYNFDDGKGNIFTGYFQIQR
jgi:gliding motility-associated-like protein